MKTYVPPAIDVIKMEETLLISESPGGNIGGHDVDDPGKPPIRTKGTGTKMRPAWVDEEDWTWHNTLWDDDEQSDVWI